MIIFSNTITPRLRYISDFIGKEIIGKPFDITADEQTFRQYDGPRINYSKTKISDSELAIQNSELLFENKINEQAIECFEINGYKAFFKTDGDFPFDIFAACFYLLSRYEEYLPHKKDIYGRYAHENSLAFTGNFLQLPLVNIWIEDFKNALRNKFTELIARNSSFTFIPTYDIDEAYAYKHKQWWRTMGGVVKSAVGGEWSMANERISVLSGRKKDPYDAFEWVDKLNKQFDLKPVYFFLVADKTAGYDKNILSLKKINAGTDPSSQRSLFDRYPSFVAKRR